MAETNTTVSMYEQLGVEKTATQVKCSFSPLRLVQVQLHSGGWFVAKRRAVFFA